MSIAGDTSPRIPGFNSYSETVLSPRRSGIAWQTATLPANATLPTATGNNSIVIGSGSASGGSNIAINGTASGGNNVIAIGGSAGSTSSYAINIGTGSANSGGISRCVNIGPGTAAQDAVNINANASPTESVVIGYGAGVGSNNTQSVIIGGRNINFNSNTSTGVVAIGSFITGVNCGNAVIIGQNITMTGSHSNAVAIGNGSSAVTDAVAIRGTSSAQNGITIRGTVNTGATNSIAIGVSSSVAANQSQSIAIGLSSIVSSGNSLAIGGSTSVGTGGNAGIAIGSSASVANSATEGICIGANATATQPYSTLIGGGGAVTIDFAGQVNIGKMAYAFGHSQVAGGTFMMNANTTDATPSNMVTIGGNNIICPDNSMYIFDIDVIGRARLGSMGTGAIAFNIKFGFHRGVGAGTVTIGALSKTIIYTVGTTTGWDVTATADTTNGRPNITVTGASSTTIAWFANGKITKITNIT